MKLYVLKVNEQGSLVVTDTLPQVSALGLRRTPGQRFQVPSIIRAAAETNNQEVVDAANVLMDEIEADLTKDGFVIIEWAIKTDAPVFIIDQQTKERIETARKWADLDLKLLDAKLMAIMNDGVGAGEAGAGTAPVVTTAGTAPVVVRRRGTANLAN